MHLYNKDQPTVTDVILNEQMSEHILGYSSAEINQLVDNT